MFHLQLGNNKGLSVIEILVAIAVIAIALTSLLNLAVFSLANSSLAKQTEKADALNKETLEAVRNFRDGTNWSAGGLGSLALDADYFLQNASGQWQIVQGAEAIGGFTRKFVLKSVARDASDNIVESGGILDPDTKKIIAAVSWQEKGRNHQVELTAYLTNWK